MLPGVIIAVRNEAETLAKNLPTLVNLFQEIVIVDNWSEDHSAEICQSFPVTWVRPETQLKRGACWNEGAQYILSSYLLFLHIDTHLSPEAILAWQKTWEPHSCDYSCFRIRFPETSFKFRFIEAISNFRSRRLRIVYGDQGLCVRKSVFDAVGGFPDEYLLEDLKISQRLKSSSYQFRFIDSPIIPSSRKFHKLGFIRYLGLMMGVLILNWFGVDTQTIYRLYYKNYGSVALRGDKNKGDSMGSS